MQRGRGRRRHRVVQLGAGAATGLGPALRRKLNRAGAAFALIGDCVKVSFAVADAPGWRIAANAVTIEVPLAQVDDMAGLFTEKLGMVTLASLPGLPFVVLP